MLLQQKQRHVSPFHRARDIVRAISEDSEPVLQNAPRID
jgi:hypothetical protein